MKRFLGILLLFFFSFSLMAQRGAVTVTGLLVDKTTDQPVDYVSVRLLHAKDSTFVLGNTTDQNGRFSLRGVAGGKYLIQASYVGYETVYTPVTITENSSSTTHVGKIMLVSSAIELAEAVIQGKKPEVIVKKDTLEYDAASYKTTENANVEELLKKLPGVEVDKDGKIMVNGKEVKKFLVDGKEFFSDDPNVASKNLPAEMVEKLQVVDRKSEMSRMTGFDDGEEETIINLTIRAGMKQGTMGNALVGAGQDIQTDNDFRYQAGAFVNHMQNNDRYTLIVGGNNNNNLGAADLGGNQFGGMRMRRGGAGGITQSENVMLNMNKEFSPKLSLNTDVRYNASDRNTLSRTSETTLLNPVQLEKTVTQNNYISDNFRLNMRMEWKPDSSNTIIFSPNFSYNKSNSDEFETAARFDVNSLDTIFDSYSNSFTKGEGYNIGLNLDYAYRFSKPGRVFSLSLRGGLNDSYSQERSYWNNRMFSGGTYMRDSIQDLQMENDNNSFNYRAQFSYVEPIGNNNFVQLSYRANQNETKSINSTYNMDRDPMNGINLPMDTATIWADRSRSTVRSSMEHRIGLSFKSVRQRYNYTVGFNVDPSNSSNKTYQPGYSDLYTGYFSSFFDGRYPNVQGDSLYSVVDQNVVNFSPVVNFNYLFGERSNLRIDYEGDTQQPTANQLRDFVDESRPNNLVRGNPNLRPSYSNELRIRFSKYVPTTQFMYNLDFSGNLVLNDIASVTEQIDQMVRLTTYENINGNWDARLRAMFNTPLRNKKFTIGGMSMSSYRHSKSYINNDLNTLNNLSLMVRLNTNYRSDLFDIGVNTMLNSSNISYTLRPDEDKQTVDWGAGAYTTWYLPHNITIESDINWTDRTGYEKGLNVSETIWNAAVSKQLFNKKAGTGTLKLQIYDILQDRRNISISTSTNGYRITESNYLPSFFMCSFIYKFKIFPGGSSASESDFQQGQGRGPGGGNFRGARRF